jgi:tetratricopeptide (TPR) repeat protein
MRIVNGIMVPPRTVDPKIPQYVEAIILKLMANEPKDRYQSAAELLVDLRSALQLHDPASGMATIRAALPGSNVPSPSRLRWTLAAAAGVVLLAGVAGYSWLAPRTPRLSESDTILIGAFENTTGEPLLDDTMVTALRNRIMQSPFLEIVSDQRIRETLRSMNRNEDDPLVKGVSREVCERLGLKAMLEGSIGRLGTSYVLRLDAIECGTGETLAREQAEASNHQNILRELGAMSSRMRKELGESLPSLQRFDVPIEQATTSSLNALKAYALGLEERRRGRDLESVAFFNQAIELDPAFASAYATLSTVYGSLGEWKRSEEFARKAYEREAKVSERERLFITYQYHDRVTGNQEKAASTLDLWKAAYPREWRPVNALGLVHHRMGQHQRAIEELQEALRRGPDQALPLSNLASAYRALGRYAEAKKTGDRAVELGIETTPTRRLLYQVGIVLGDGSAAAHLAWAKDRSRQFDLVSAQAQVAAYEGRLSESLELYRQAVDMAKARDLRGTASGYAAHLAWTEALYGGKEAAAGVHRALALVAPGPDGPGAIPRFRAPAALALVGSDADALQVVTGAENSYPEATFVRTVLSPVTRASIALRQGKPGDALKVLEPAALTELGTVAGLIPPYLRAEAFLASGAFADAIREYQKVLQNRGVDPFAQVLPLAQLGLARAHARTGDLDAARRAYDELFTLWKNAEPNFEPLAAARAEYARLTTPPSVP